MLTYTLYSGAPVTPLALSATMLGDSRSYAYQITMDDPAAVQGVGAVHESLDGNGFFVVTTTPVVQAHSAGPPVVLANTYVPVPTTEAAYTRITVTGAAGLPTSKMTVTLVIKQ